MSSPRIPPASALAALEPRPGGQWTINQQEGDATSLSYVMGNGSETITYTLHQCQTEEDIRKHCSSFVYEYTDDVSQPEYYHQTLHEVPPEFGDSQEAASLLYHSQAESVMPQYPAGIQQPLQPQLLFGTEATIISPSEPQAQASIQFEGAALPPQHHFYQHGQIYPMSNSQQLPHEGFAAGTSEWTLNNELFPANIGDAPISMLNTGIELAPDNTMFLGAWQQNWAHVNPNPTQGPGGEWDAFFSQH